MTVRAKVKTVTDGSGASAALVEWRAMFLDALPVLEWCAAHPEHVGAIRAEDARRVLVRYYLATSSRPGLAKTQGQESER